MKYFNLANILFVVGALLLIPVNALIDSNLGLSRLLTFLALGLFGYAIYLKYTADPEPAKPVFNSDKRKAKKAAKKNAKKAKKKAANALLKASMAKTSPPQQTLPPQHVTKAVTSPAESLDSRETVEQSESPNSGRSQDLYDPSKGGNNKLAATESSDEESIPVVPTTTIPKPKQNDDVSNQTAEMIVDMENFLLKKSPKNPHSS